ADKAECILSFSELFEAGTVETFTYADSIPASPATDKRYRLSNTPGTSVTVTAATTITGSYVTQHQVSFAQSGIGGDTGANTVLTVGGTTFTKIDLTDTRF